MIPLHLGALHPIEQALTLILAFGPFLLLGLVVWLRKRADRREDARAESVAASQSDRQADRHADGRVGSHAGSHADR